MGKPSPHLDRVRRVLTNNKFLGSLPSAVREALICKGQLKSFAKNAVVYRRGSPGDSLMVAIKGRIKLPITSVDGKEIVLHYVGSGEVFGEIAALDGDKRAADAIALEDAEVFIVASRDLLPTLMAHPAAMMEVIRALCERIRAGAAIIVDNTLEMRGRTARGLLRLARRSIGPDGDYLRLTMSQEELGRHLGMSRGNVNRQLGQLKTANVIKINGMEITIIDERALMEIVQAPPAKEI